MVPRCMSVALIKLDSMYFVRKSCCGVRRSTVVVPRRLSTAIKIERLVAVSSQRMGVVSIDSGHAVP